jgi:NAD(P)-dependent dehydrogenase (short-subunit alcohol dehydrogenase family)
MTGQPLRGRIALVTGGSRGLGLEIARHYLAAGASVALCARTTDPTDAANMAETVAAELRSGLTERQEVIGLTADVAQQADVARLHAEVLRHFGRIDVLVNNAAVQGPMGPVESVDWQAWVRTVEINLMGSVLMTRAVLPAMKMQGRGRIVQLSGGGATSPMPGISAYAVSKAAIVRFVETLARELEGTGVEINALAPGALNTRMLDEVLAAGPEKVGQAYFARATQQKNAGGADLQEAAALAVFLGSEASRGISGRLISAVWDNWRHLPEHAATLAASDVYTLRRITGKDRGLDWGDR